MPSQINFNPLRAFGSNGNPSAGALAYFYETGTSTPLTVYTDDSLATAHQSPLPADAQGVFPPVFVDGATAVKVNVTTSTGAALTGYPLDPVQLVSSTGSAASQVSFSPITGNAATDVQGAIQNLTTLWNAVTTFGKSLIAASSATAARTTLGLGGLATLNILDEDDMATNSATRPPSQQSVRAFVNGKRFTSPARTITSAGSLTLAHGLGVAPGFVSFRLKCLTAENGYSVGDEVIVGSNGSYDSPDLRMTTAYIDATNVYVRFSNNTFAFGAAHKSTGAPVGLTNANWELYVEAMA